MYQKKIKNYYIIIGGVALDVSRQDGVYRIIAAVCNNDTRMVYSLNGELLSANTRDPKVIAYMNVRVKRNLKRLNKLAKERESKCQNT